MTRREIRKNVFLLLFRRSFMITGFNGAMDIHLSQLQKSTEEEKSYIYERIKAILGKLMLLMIYFQRRPVVGP